MPTESHCGVSSGSAGVVRDRLLLGLWVGGNRHGGCCQGVEKVASCHVFILPWIVAAAAGVAVFLYWQPINIGHDKMCGCCGSEGCV